MEEKQFKMPMDVKPIYADEVNVNSNIKVNIDTEEKGEGKEKISKVGRVDVLFFDQFTKSIISRVVIDPYTAKQLGKILIANADRLIMEIEKEGIPDEVRQRIKNQKESTEKADISHSYIG